MSSALNVRRCWGKPFSLFKLDWKPLTGSLANNANPDKMPHIAAFYLSFHCLLRQNQSSRKKKLVLEIIKVRNAAKIRNQYNQVPHLTKNTTWESDKITIKHH